MATAILIVVYLCYISLGLPDSVLGVVWPPMRQDLNQPLEVLSSVQLVIVLSTIVSSFLYGRFVRKIGTGRLVLICVLLTGTSLLGISFIPDIKWFYCLAIPLGLGAGAIDASLNNYVAENYKPRYMSWLHSFWGIGAIISPLIVTRLIAGGHSWRIGYRSISGIQLSIAAILLLSQPLWKKLARQREEAGEGRPPESHYPKAWRTKGAKSSLLLFFLYCGAENSMVLWVVSYLYEYKHLPYTLAGIAQALYFCGITAGRVTSGILVDKAGNRLLVKIGMMTAAVGAFVLIFSNNAVLSLCAVVFTGLGLAPVYPCMMHESVSRFRGKGHTEIVGYQVGMASVGIAVIPVTIGYLSKPLTLIIMPIAVICLAVISLAVSSRLNKIT